MDTDSFFIYIESGDFHKCIADDVEGWFDTSNLNENDKNPLPIGKESTRCFLPSSKKVADFFKIELRGKIMKEFCALRAKPYAYILDDDNEKEKKQRNKKSE